MNRYRVGWYAFYLDGSFENAHSREVDAFTAADAVTQVEVELRSSPHARVMSVEPIPATPARD